MLSSLLGLPRQPVLDWELRLSTTQAPANRLSVEPAIETARQLTDLTVRSLTSPGARSAARFASQAYLGGPLKSPRLSQSPGPACFKSESANGRAQPASGTKRAPEINRAASFSPHSLPSMPVTMASTASPSGLGSPAQHGSTTPSSGPPPLQAGASVEFSGHITEDSSGFTLPKEGSRSQSLLGGQLPTDALSPSSSVLGAAAAQQVRWHSAVRWHLPPSPPPFCRRLSLTQAGVLWLWQARGLPLQPQLPGAAAASERHTLLQHDMATSTSAFPRNFDLDESTASSVLSDASAASQDWRQIRRLARLRVLKRKALKTGASTLPQQEQELLLVDPASRTPRLLTPGEIANPSYLLSTPRAQRQAGGGALPTRLHAGDQSGHTAGASPQLQPAGTQLPGYVSPLLRPAKAQGPESPLPFTPLGQRVPSGVSPSPLSAARPSRVKRDTESRLREFLSTPPRVKATGATPAEQAEAMAAAEEAQAEPATPGAAPPGSKEAAADTLGTLDRLLESSRSRKKERATPGTEQRSECGKMLPTLSCLHATVGPRLFLTGSGERVSTHLLFFFDPVQARASWTTRSRSTSSSPS